MSTALGFASIADEPFVHAVFPRLPLPGLAEVGAGLASSSEWRTHWSDFIDQDEIALRPEHLSGAVAAALPVPTILSALTTVFGVPFHPWLVLDAHRLGPGQRIGIHTDGAGELAETHRLILHLGPDRDDRDGGHLLLFGSEDPRDLRRALRPRFGSAVALPLTRRAFHAVSRVNAGERLTLVASAWENRTRAPGFATTLLADRPGRLFGEHPIPGNTAADRAVRLLVARGADRDRHSGGTLLRHLYETTALLHGWDQPEAVVLAGLCHSAYGTAGFTGGPLEPHERPLLAGAIGPEAESLVHLYGGAAPGAVLRRAGMLWMRDGSPRVVSPTVRAQLATLELANLLEQAVRDDAIDPASAGAPYRAWLDVLPSPAVSAWRRFTGESDPTVEVLRTDDEVAPDELLSPPERR